MAIDKVRDYLKKYNMENQILEFDGSSATVLEAAERINCDYQLIAKTMSFMINNEPILIVTAGDMKIDNHKYKEYFHEKAHMLEYDKVEELIGHAVGGVCPFAVNKNVKVYLDKSLKRFSFVYPACGSSNSAIKLTINELEKLSNYESWIDVCRLINVI